MSADAIISLSNLTKAYPTKTFAGVQNINLNIAPASIVAVVGESGSGKSTLLKLIYGLLEPDSGVVNFKGNPVQGPHQKLIPGHNRMKMVTQDFSLNIYAKVYDNIAAMLPNTDLKAKDQETVELMEFLRIDHLAQKRVTDLSGGEQQRVAIARAIITEPEVLLLDEPFSQVDSLLKNDLRADIKRLAAYLGITVIIVSHDPADALSLADEMVILRKGALIEKGSPHNLYHHPDYLYTARLLANCNAISKEEAKQIGLNINKNTMAIYPEWIRMEENPNSLSFQVKDILFKGFYEELVLEKDGVCLHAFNNLPGIYHKGQDVQVSINRYLEFDEE